MRTYLDVLNLLKQYDIYIHLGKRLWDLELAAIEVDNLYRAKLINPKTYAQIKLVLNREHEQEMQRENEKENL